MRAAMTVRLLPWPKISGRHRQGSRTYDIDMAQCTLWLKSGVVSLQSATDIAVQKREVSGPTVYGTYLGKAPRMPSR